MSSDPTSSSAPSGAIPDTSTISKPISTPSNNDTPLPISSPSTSTSPHPTKTILLINGPNLNLLSYREPEIYGSTKLKDIEAHLQTLASSRGIRVLSFQSNHEGAIVDRLHEAFWANLKAKEEEEEEVGAGVRTDDDDGADASSSSRDLATVDAVIINPGAYTHTSVAIRDALAGVSIPFVECHISNVHAREEFRHKSFLSDKAVAVIAGLGVYGYVAALEFWCWKWKGGKLEDAGV